MKKIFFAIGVICCFLNMQCEPSDDIAIDLDNLLIGNWTNPEYEGDSITLKRVNILPDHSYGMSFNSKGEFIERTSGWCGTPPLVFYDYEGVYTLVESVISITQDHFPNSYSWRILSVTEDELILTKELTEQEKDYRDLMNTFDDALDLIEGIPCENEDNWTFTPYGAKACGGPQWFIAYPNTINTAQFLNKIEIYTQAEVAYNKKWSIFSTCDVIAPPTDVVCDNGYPVLKF